MPEKTTLTNIDKNMQKTAELLTTQGRKEDKREAQRKVENEETKKTNLSTWGSIKAGFDSFIAPLQTSYKTNKVSLENISSEIKDSVNEETKTNLSTWGSIKAGFDAFNISLENDEENKITWGKLGSQLKDSVSEWYNQTKEMDNMLGATFRMGSAIWENINTHLISNLKTAFSNITSGVREVLGPVAEAFDTMKNVVMGVFGFFKGMIGSIFGAKVKPEDKVRNKLLQGIVDYFKDEKKAEAREGVKKKIPKTLQMLLLGLGIVIGAVVGVILAPFRLLLKILSPFNVILKGIWKKLKPIRTFFNIIGTKIKTFLEPITKLFGEGGRFGKISKVMKKMGIFLKPLMAGFKLGFKVLGWPLTILLGIIDAIKASWAKYKEGGTVYEIIMAGIKGAFMGLFELPVKILGWIGDKILKIFGEEIEGGLAQKIMDVLSEVFDWIVNLPLKIIEAGKNLFGLSQTEEEKKKDQEKYLSSEKKSPAEIKQYADDLEIQRAKMQATLAEFDKKKAAQEAEDKKTDKAETKKQGKEVVAAITNQTITNNQTTVEPIPDEIDGSLIGVAMLWDF